MFKMITVYYKHFEIEVIPFINQQGNTSYLLDVFDYSRGGAFAYRLIRYQWRGGTNYFLCSDSECWCGFPVRVKELLHGFNWSYVRRAIKEREHFKDAWFDSTLPF